MKRAIALLLLFIALLTISARAEDASDIGLGTYGIFRDVNDNRYVIQDDRIQYGEIHYRKNWYYAYRTSRPGKPRGSLCTNAYKRLGRNRWRFFRKTGQALKQDTKYIKLYEFWGKYIQYIYIPGTNFTLRYSCKKERYERRVKKGTPWREVGMQCYYWDMDTQK